LSNFVYAVKTTSYDAYADNSLLSNSNDTYGQIASTSQTYSGDNSYTQITVSYTQGSGNVSDGIVMPNTGAQGDYIVLSFGGITLAPQAFRAYKGTIDAGAGAPLILSGTSFEYMFADVSGNGLVGIGSWDVSGVNNMSKAFKDSTTFNKDISGWDVSAVTDMSEMFYGASAFNQDIGSWDTSSLTELSQIFRGATVFNQALTWDFSGVTNFSHMFNGASAFNSSVAGWTLGTIENAQYMFASTSFNQDIGSWDISGATNISHMLYSTPFNQDITGWNTGNVTDFSWVVGKCGSFTYNIAGWDLSSATNIRGMITDCGYDYEQYSNFIITLASNNTLPLSLNIGHTGLVRYDNSATNNALTTLQTTDLLTILDAGSYSPALLDNPNIVAEYKINLEDNGSTTAIPTDKRYSIINIGGEVEDVAETFTYGITFTDGLTFTLRYNLEEGQALVVRNNNSEGSIYATYTGPSVDDELIDITGLSGLHFTLTFS
jgi:surface protein